MRTTFFQVDFTFPVLKVSILKLNQNFKMPSIKEDLLKKEFKLMDKILLMLMNISNSIEKIYLFLHYYKLELVINFCL